MRLVAACAAALVLCGSAAAGLPRHGTLVPGRVYYAIVTERPGGLALLALNPRSPEGRWSHRDEYLRATPRVQMDPEKVTRAANEVGDPDPIIKAAEAHVAGLESAARLEHQIQENDGL